MEGPVERQGPGEDGGAGVEALLVGAEALAAALEGDGRDVHGSVLLSGKAQAEEALRVLQDGTRIRGHLFMARVDTAALVFPPRLVVDGGLTISDCNLLTELSFGEGLEIGGDLDVLNCGALTSLPAGLSVGGDLRVPLCKALASLPPDLHVGGDLKLGGCNALRSLPEGLRVGGSIQLHMCPVLKSLPESIQVGGGLKMFNCASLASLPRGLRVPGDLDLHSCSNLSDLPERLQVGGLLSLSGCTALEGQHGDDMESFLRRLEEIAGPTGGLRLSGWKSLRALPEGFGISGALYLQNCTGITCLPAKLCVGGSLDLSFCSALVDLPADLKVGGGLNLGHCKALEERHREGMGHFLQHLQDTVGPGGGLGLAGWQSLTEIPAGFGVGGALDLENCCNLVQLPEDLYVGGDLNLFNCWALTSLPRGLRVRDNLNLGNCEALTSIAEGISVGGNFGLTTCTALQSLPDGLRVNGALTINMCSALTSLPDGLQVESDLQLYTCTALTRLPAGLSIGGRFRGGNLFDLGSLPADLSVDGGIELHDLTSLTGLPEGFKSQGELRLIRCPALVALPEGLEVGGDLVLFSCERLAGLPERLYVGGDLSLERCESLQSLPASILEWPVREGGEPHNIDLTGTGLSAETLEWLRAADAPGLRFHVDLGRGVRGASLFKSTEEAATFWLKEAELDEGEMSSEGAVPVPMEDITLVRFLSRLRDAKEFGIAETRKALAKRVVSVLELLEQDQDAREELLLRMGDSLDACGDKPVWALNQMHLVVEIAKARESAEQLRDLGRRVMRLMVVHEHAKRKIDSHSWVDDVCVYLRFEIELREALDLPVDASAMIFPNYIKVEDQELEAAKDDALAITDQQFKSWLVGWPEWQRQARHEVAKGIKWERLPEIKQRQSLRKRLSRRLSQLVNVSGDQMVDPVTLDFGKSTWALRDLLRHWERTGLDMHNSVVSPDELEQSLRRCSA